MPNGYEQRQSDKRIDARNELLEKINALATENAALLAKNEALRRRIEKLEHPNATYSWGGG